MTTAQELCDTCTELAALRTQFAEAQRHQFDTEHCADHAEQQLQFMRMLQDATMAPGHDCFDFRTLHHPSPRLLQHDHQCSWTRSTPCHCFQVTYQNSGSHSYWGYPEDAPAFWSQSPHHYCEVLNMPSCGPDSYWGPNSCHPFDLIWGLTPPPSLQPQHFHPSVT